MNVSRRQVIGYRVAASGLHRTERRAADLGVLDIGIQDAMGHPAALAFAARLPADVSPRVAVGPRHRFALAWTLRGAPHVHRRRDLDAVAAALWPLSEADAGVRLNESGPAVARAGIPALEQFAIAVDAMYSVVTAPIAKGAASTALTRRIPEPMRRSCRVCKTTHISDSAMRVAAGAAGVELEPGSPPVLVPRGDARAPNEHDPAALGELARAYLRHLGPAGPKQVAGYLGARNADVAAMWKPTPPEFVEVSVDGRRGWLPAEAEDDLAGAPEPDLVRLLGPFDPYLQARDRDLIVPDKAVQKALWPVLGRPGALFVDGEVVGGWRTRTAGGTLTITVEAFTMLPASTWREIESEAARVGEARGAKEVVVTQKS